MQRTCFDALKVSCGLVIEEELNHGMQENGHKSDLMTLIENQKSVLEKVLELLKQTDKQMEKIKDYAEIDFLTMEMWKPRDSFWLPNHIRFILFYSELNSEEFEKHWHIYLN